MRVRKLNELTPEQIAELRCPMPSMKMLEKTVDLGVGELAFDGIEEALIPAIALQEFRNAFNITTLGQIVNIQAADFPVPTARFVYRVIQSKGRFKDADEVLEAMYAPQIKHAFAVAARICYGKSEDLPEESRDFFSKPHLIQEIISSEELLTRLAEMYAIETINSEVIKQVALKVNELADKLKVEKVTLPELVKSSGATSDENAQPSCSSTDSVVEEPPAKPLAESTDTTPV